ncbi:ABC transporter ATP-binding protein [Streptomyces sp. ISL-36]|nr:ABC transporter ATP-binding protein [Streptomyces sp. ISL-36]
MRRITEPLGTRAVEAGQGLSPADAPSGGRGPGPTDAGTSGPGTTDPGAVVGDRPGVGVGTIRAEGLRFGYPGREVLAGVDLSVQAGELVALVGLNGCGKSTLLRLCAGLLRPAEGRVLLDGDDLSRLSRRAAARRVAILHQAAPAVPGMTVRQLVRQGRYAVRGPLGMLRDSDDSVCARAMADVGVAEWVDRPVDALSGGERQRVRLAMALAQDTRLLLLDEPTTYLDLRHQLEVMGTVVRLREERGLTVVMVLHDLGHAARFADRIVALRQGRIAADGPPEEVVTPRLLAEVLGVAGRVGRDPEGGWPVCYPDHPLDTEATIAK